VPVEPPVEPKPAASVVLVRPAGSDAAEPLEVYLIRRRRELRFLGGYYAFPGGRVDAADASPQALGRCLGHTAETAETVFPGGACPALAYWVTAVRELLEETGVLVACDGAGRPLDGADPRTATAIAEVRDAVMAGQASLGVLLAERGWWLDVRGLRYLAHFITPTQSPIRFSARFFLGALPPGQAPRLYPEETSEAFWIGPADGYRRFRAGELPMAEPAEYALGYLAQFDSWSALWEAHQDGRHKFHGIIDRIDTFWEPFDWTASRWRGTAPGVSVPGGAA
jgi:ribonuclease/clavin/mitogillin